MKKVIRLTESELERIIKKVISEAPLTAYTPPDIAATASANLPRAKSIPTNISTETKPVPIPVSAPKTIFGVGDKGPEILAFQKHLVALGYNVGKKGADGIFGPATEAAVKEFQAKYGIKVSGRVGPPTKGKLATVASAPKPTYDPTAEWNQDRREDGNTPTTAQQKTAPVQGGNQKNISLSGLLPPGPAQIGMDAISSIGPGLRGIKKGITSQKEKQAKERAKYQEFIKSHPEYKVPGIIPSIKRTFGK